MLVIPIEGPRLYRLCTPCHPDRSDPIFSSAPQSAAPGRVARLVRPARFAGVEGSRHNLPLAQSLLTVLFGFSFSCKLSTVGFRLFSVPSVASVFSV
jgi:hypothetical protein